ncbi:MAG TPA: LamG-like jellyroll fold domain-containing protein, partial [Tepidisphaeraceae bacterium]|nr:LamG-like jellyroll fold domain-containing protein [Tepidisphaeraceae bacterium]
MKTSVRPFVAASTLALACIAASAADYQTTVSGFGPLGYWRLDETTTAPAVNKVSNVGSLGSSADGMVVLDVGKGEPGVVGNSIRLNNPGPTTGYAGSKVDVPYNAGLNPVPPFSIEFWAKPNSLAGTDSTGVCPLSSFDPNNFGGANRSGYLFYVNNSGTWQFRLGTVGGYAGICTASGANATLGVWQHIVGTYDGATARLYVNGNLAGSTAASVADWTRNTEMALRLGGTGLQGNLSDGPLISVAGYAGNRQFDGWLDEVAVYPSLLSASQVKAHFDAATTNNAGYGAQILANGPVGYWHLDEPAVTAPNPSTFPVLANVGSLGSAADATNTWGSLTAQAGSGYGGLGVANKACLMNGEAGGINVKDAPGLHFSGNVTLMAWVKPTVKDFFRDIIAHGWAGNYAETFLRISRNNGDVFPAQGYGDGTNYYEIGTSDGNFYYDAAYYPIPDGDIGNWVFIAGTFDGANWNLFRNGKLVASIPADPLDSGALDVTNAWTIGSRAYETSSAQNFGAVGLFFGGGIDEPAIFNTALSEANINAIYNSAQVPPVITRAPAHPIGTVYRNASASLDVWAEGSPTLGYLWLSNGISTGVTTTNMTLNNLPAGNLTISVVVTNLYGSATGAVTFPVIASPPLIVQQPAAETRFNGRPFSFSVSALGSLPLSYQWNTNGVPISGATSPTYAGIASAATALSYSCTVTNQDGISNSVAVALTVLPIPGGYAGAVLADGPVSYWRLGESSGTVAHDYYGGNDGNYFSATLGQPGYSAIDSDTAVSFSGGLNSYVGNITGSGVLFSGKTNFTIELWANGPSGQSDESTLIAKGSGSSGTLATEQFSIDIAGGNYRFFTRGGGNTFYEADATTGPNNTWQHIVGVYDDAASTMHIYVNGVDQGQGGTRAAGVRSFLNPISIGSKHLGNDPNYDGAFAGAVDEVAIYPYALSAPQVQAHYSAAYGPSLPPTISIEPTSLTNYVTLPGSFSVGAYGTVPLTYQWFKGASPLSDGGTISGTSSAKLTINPLALADAGNYSVRINNVNGTTNSTVVSLTVLSAPTTPPSIPGLVMHLTFDNTLVDATGRGNSATSMHTTFTATNTVAPTYASDGKLGQAFHYSSDMGPPLGDGNGSPTTTNNFYATLGVRPDLLFGTDMSFTIAYWIRLPANYTGGDLPFFTDTVNSTFGSGYVLAPSFGPDAVGASTGTAPGGWAMSVFDVAGAGAGYYGEIGSINDGNWHHLVHVIQRGVGTVTYLDGAVAKASKQAGTSVGAASGSLDSTPPNPATIGQDPTGHYGETGSGDIDDLGVWRKALTPLEAASLYAAASINGQSFAGTYPTAITVEVLPGHQLRLSWPYGILQSATSVTGPYTAVSGAASPYTTS